MLSILSGNINILADGILVGQRLGTDALAAINFSLPVYLVLCIAGSFIVSGTAICASEAIGNNQAERAQALYRAAVFWCAVSSAAITAAGLFFSKASDRAAVRGGGCGRSDSTLCGRDSGRGAA